MARECPAFSKSTLYKLVAEAEANGLAKEGVVLRPAGPPLIHRRRFDAWLERRRKGTRPNGKRKS